MASFTDQISQFNPYVSRLPLIQEMASATQEKQQKYDQGVQKIQGYVDNIAGMDIMNDTQKEYLQSKLNELGSRLRTVAAGDFSNAQLVNSVGGMAGQIIKDPLIQNAVASTQRARNELNTANTLYKAGKSSISNVKDIQKKVGNYVNSKDVNQSFTDKYVNYVDLNKKNIEIADSLKKTAPENSRDNYYKTDYLGQTIYYFKDKNGDYVKNSDGTIKVSTDKSSGGVPELDKAMKKVTIKGVSAQTMYDAISSNLTDDDLAQMRINASAHYEGKGADSILRDYVDGVDLAKTVIKDGIRKLNVELGDPKYTQAEKDEMQAQINKLNNKLTDGSFIKETQDFAKSLENPANIDKIHYDAYTRNYLNKQATILSNQSYKEELLDNPYQKAYHDDAVLQQTIIRDNQNRQKDVADIKYKYDALANQKYEFKLTTDQKNKEFQAKYPGIVVEDSPIATNMEVPTLGNVDVVIGQTIKDQQTLNNKYTKSLGKDQADLDELYKKYRIDPKSVVANEEVKYVQSRDAFENKLVMQNNIKKKVEEGSKVFDKKIDVALEKVKGVNDINGKPLFTAKEIYDVDGLLSKYYTVKTVAAGVGGVSFINSFDEAGFRKSIGNNPSNIAIADVLVKKIKGGTLLPKEKIIADRMIEIHREVAKSLGPIQKEKFDYQTKTIARYDPHYQQQLGTINKANDYDMGMLEQLVGNTISKLEQGQGLDMPSGFDQPTRDGLSKMMAKGADGKLLVSPVIRKNRDGSALVELHQGSDVEIIPVTANNLAKYFKKIAVTNPYNEDFYSVAASPFNSTNKSQTGPGDKSADQVTAAHSGYDIPNLRGTPYEKRVRFDIIGDPDNDEVDEINSKKFAVRFFVQDAKGQWIPDVTTGGYRSASTIQDYIDNQVGTKTIDQFLKTHNNK